MAADVLCVWKREDRGVTICEVHMMEELAASGWSKREAIDGDRCDICGNVFIAKAGYKGKWWRP